jgi:hypothetical protein
MTQATTPAYLKRSQYAAHIGRSPGYITQLAAQGRVVFTPDGRFVDVAKTNALLAQTADPAKQSVADRHAAARQAAADLRDADHEVQRHLPPNEPDPDHTASEYNFQGAKAKREHYAAEREHAAYLKEAGELMERGQVLAAFAEAGTLIRARLESWPNLMPPLLVGQPEDALQRTLAEHVENLLRDLSDTFGRLAKEDHPA